MRAILVAMGSMGDTLPFMNLGKTLVARGHHVTLAASGYFRRHALDAGFDHAETFSLEEWNDFIAGQSRWSEIEGLRRMGRMVIELAPRVFDAIRDRYEPGTTVVAAQGYAFGARLAQEALGVPLATVHLQPMWFRSVYDPPTAPAWFPFFLRHGIDRLLDWLVDRRLAPPINALRAEHGRGPERRLMKHWWNSPQRVLGMFPDWYNPPQPDWPANVLLPGFPLPPASGTCDTGDPIVEDFLATGPAPIVFSQSSISTDQDYCRQSIAIARRLERRAILLTPNHDLAASDLPPTVRAFRHVPLEHLLPRAALHVHHGGIGTIAHTLRAGIPHLTVPMVYDQPDNSLRLQKLGVADLVTRRRYHPRRVVPRIRQLLESPTVAEQCRTYAARMRASEPLEVAADALEALLPATAHPAASVKETPIPVEPG